jgi:hypothetical protein
VNSDQSHLAKSCICIDCTFGKQACTQIGEKESEMGAIVGHGYGLGTGMDTFTLKQSNSLIVN